VRRNLMATFWPSASCTATTTTPMPPAARSRSTRYLPDTMSPTSTGDARFSRAVRRASAKLSAMASQHTGAREGAKHRTAGDKAKKAPASQLVDLPPSAVDPQDVKLTGLDADPDDGIVRAGAQPMVWRVPFEGALARLGEAYDGAVEREGFVHAQI